jgi:hypothetical protein
LARCLLLCLCLCTVFFTQFSSATNDQCAALSEY